MKEFWSKKAASLTPYVPGEQPKDRRYVKLNTNENPYPPSPKALEAIRAATGDLLRLYPDPECTELRQAAADGFGLRPEEVFVGNGSDEILAFCFQALFDPDRPILFADITYSFYPVYARMFGIPYEIAPLDQDFRLPVEAYCKGTAGGILIARPNAPTGEPVSLEDLERILKANASAPVVVDEAYVDFGDPSAMGLIRDYPNLLVVQTLSKSRSLAGLRVGFALGNENLIQALNTVKNSINSYTIDRLALAGAKAALEDRAYFEECCGKIIRTREETAKRLERLGFRVLPSKSNFLFVCHESRAAKELLDGLRQEGILVRWWSQDRIRNFLRITVGTDEEMDILCRTLERLLEKGAN